MAGQGFKTFGVGDVLTASDVNGYLMQQAVMNFADSGARGSAIGTATEGMLSYLADTDAVEVYDGSAWTAVGSDPGVLQVVSTTKTDTFTTSSTSYTDVTGLAVTITPSSASNKVLLIASISGKRNNSGSLLSFVTVLRGATNLVNPDSPGSRTPSFVAGPELSATSTTGLLENYQFIILDSPATTSATTYQVQAFTQSGGTFFVNRSSTDTNSAAFPRGISTITAIEVAA